MPELPDVEALRAHLEHCDLHRTIVRTHVRDRKVLDAVTPQSLGAKLSKHRLRETRRHGKYLFARVDRNGWLTLHFGMTGGLSDFAAEEEPPPNTAAVIHFDDGGRLAYRSQRKLGLITWTENPDEFRRQRNIGIDALAPELTQERFLAMLDGKRSGLKSALMQQSFLGGIGNEWSDELLFQGKWPPRTKLADLDERQRRRLYRIMRRVLQTGVRARRGKRPLPQGYLGHHRHKDNRCPTCGQPFARTTAAGRTCFYCPTCQREQTAQPQDSRHYNETG